MSKSKEFEEGAIGSISGKDMNMKFVVEVGDNVRRKNQYHLQNFHVTSAHPSDISSGKIVTF